MIFKEIISIFFQYEAIASPTVGMCILESGKTATDVEPFRKIMLLRILGVGSVAVTWLKRQTSVG